MQIKMPDGCVYDEEGTKLTKLRDFLEQHKDLKKFKYKYFNFYIGCRVIFISENNCLVATNGTEKLMDLEYYERFEPADDDVLYKVEGKFL
jgi:hypothetical protein